MARLQNVNLGSNQPSGFKSRPTYHFKEAIMLVIVAFVIALLIVIFTDD